MVHDGTLERAAVADPGPAGRRGYHNDPMVPILQLEGVVKKYRRGDEQLRVLVDFNFTLDAGEFVVVTGPSGAGKSTLLHIAGGLDAPDAGTVACRRQGRVDDERRRARRVPAAQPRIRVPVLQLGAHADRNRERLVAAGARRCAGPISGRTRRGAPATGRARGPGPTPAGRTVWWADATGGGGTRTGSPAVDHPR